MLGQEVGDLEGGVDALFDLPEELEDQALAEYDRVVGLLRAGDVRSQLATTAAQAVECRRAHALERADATAEAPPAADRVGQGGVELRLAQRVDDRSIGAPAERHRVLLRVTVTVANLGDLHLGAAQGYR